MSIIKLKDDVELLMWSPAKSEDSDERDPPTVSQMRHALAARGYSEDYAEPVPRTTAFRRHLKSLECKNTKVTCVEKDGRVCGQLDEIVSDVGTRRIRREFLKSWELDNETGEISGSDDIAYDVAHAETRYAWSDLTKIIKAMLAKECLGAYSPRKGGAVYFCPVSTREQLDKLQACFGEVGMNILRYQIPETAAQLDEIATAIADSLDAEIQAHQEALETYSEQTKPGVILNRIESLNGTLAMANRLQPHLQAKAGPLVEKIASLTAKAEALHLKAESYRPVHQQGRRVMTGT